MPTEQDKRGGIPQNPRCIYTVSILYRDFQGLSGIYKDASGNFADDSQARVDTSGRLTESPLQISYGAGGGFGRGRMLTGELARTILWACLFVRMSRAPCGRKFRTVSGPNGSSTKENLWVSCGFLTHLPGQARFLVRNGRPDRSPLQFSQVAGDPMGSPYTFI